MNDMNDETSKLHPYWISWYHCADDGPYELHLPWWVTGFTGFGDQDPVLEMVCAAVRAVNEDEAKELIRQSYNNPPVDIEWRFVHECEDDWTPFKDRFPRKDWMLW